MPGTTPYSLKIISFSGQEEYGMEPAEPGADRNHTGESTLKCRRKEGRPALLDG
jgi:hypothetical protein